MREWLPGLLAASTPARHVLLLPDGLSTMDLACPDSV
jgi:hypothetical protein